MKILVTGSSGLVGKKVAELLAKQNHFVVAFDHSNNCDILDLEQLQTHMSDCQAVVHCAALLNEKKGTDLLWRTNVQGTQKVVDACVKNKVQRLVFLSSVGVYGNQPGIKNEESALAPQALYEKSKVHAEQIVQNAGISFTIIRSAMVVGPNPQWKRLIRLVKQNMPLIGSGKQTWQTIHYADLANAVVFLLFSKQAINEVFVVAGNEQPSLLEFTQTIRNSLGKKNRVQTIPLWLGQVASTCGTVLFKILQKQNPLSQTHLDAMMNERRYDISKITQLGWKNQFSFEQSIQETIRELDESDKNTQRN